MEINPLGASSIYLKLHKDNITYKKNKATLKNIIFGTMYVEHYGEMTFNNHTTGDIGKLILKERSWNGIKKFNNSFIIFF